MIDEFCEILCSHVPKVKAATALFRAKDVEIVETVIIQLFFGNVLLRQTVLKTGKFIRNMPVGER